MKQELLNWWSITTKPGQSASYILSKSTTKQMIWVLVLLSIVFTLLQLGLHWPKSILDGVISGFRYFFLQLLEIVLTVILSSSILKFVGGFIGGKGSWKNIARSLIWSFVPSLMIIMIPSLFVFFLLILKNANIISISHSVFSGSVVVWNWCVGIASAVGLIYQITFVAIAQNLSWVKSFYLHLLLVIVILGLILVIVAIYVIFLSIQVIIH